MPINHKLAALLQNTAQPMHSLGVDRARAVAARFAALQLPAQVSIGSIKELSVPTVYRTTPVRVYLPREAGPAPAFVFLHGGGWSMGSMDHYDGLCRLITSLAGCATIAVDYGLAPEYKFPHALEECYAVLKWLQEQAEVINIQRDNIAIGGDSAGGNLSAALCLLARERAEFMPVYQVLLYPVTQLNSQTQSKSKYGRGFFIDSEDMVWFTENYLKTPAEMENNLASPLNAATLAGLPEALVITAEYDPLRDEGEAYARRLLQSGVAVVHKRMEGMIHAFLSMNWLIPEEVQAMMEFIAMHLRRKFQQS